MIDFLMSISQDKTKINFSGEYEQITRKVNGLFFNLAYRKEYGVRLYEDKDKIYLIDANPNFIDYDKLRRYINSGLFKEIPGFFFEKPTIYIAAQFK